MVMQVGLMPRRELGDTAFARWLGRFMKARGLSSRAVADDTGLSASTIGEWLGGKRDIKVGSLTQFADAYDLPPNDLWTLVLGGEESAALREANAKYDALTREIDQRVRIALAPIRRFAQEHKIRFRPKLD